jgi:hypothetical protein
VVVGTTQHTLLALILAGLVEVVPLVIPHPLVVERVRRVLMVMVVAEGLVEPLPAVLGVLELLLFVTH